MATPTILTTPRTLTLSSEEAVVRKISVDAAQEIDRDRPEDDPLVLRFTGGWARDKLLGLQSADLDVGIQNMTGYDFATRLSEHISANTAKYGTKLGSVNKIGSNPKKSKHLETARVGFLSALKTKISRERVGMEIDGMFKGCNAHASLSLIHEVDLYNEIFAPPIQDLPVLPVHDMKIAANIVRHRLFGSTSPHPRISELLTTTSEKYLVWLIAAMSPRKNQPLYLAYNKNMPAAATAIKEGLRCPNNVSGTIAKVFANWKVIQNMVINLEHWGRGKTALEMRALDTDWKNQVGACLMFELMDLKENANDDDEVEERVMDKYETFLKTIAEEGLEEAPNFKCLLTVSSPPLLSSHNSGVVANSWGYQGNDVAAEYALTSGAWMKPTIERSLQHQLDNLHKGKDELLQWVRGNRQALLDGLEYVGVSVGEGKKTR
ncbi:hypothetical protein C7212DRAFT_340109 [Tuber magnatum]|uniref:Poly A polymerase head domain-containing protein n=1 Tax=Tuber magnatum TaxID=42249 RepID=A0A317T0E1_9PEZI|nr:hypothetical protein C7212DRAFT_340109 [Tuber magnatum]